MTFVQEYTLYFLQGSQLFISFKAFGTSGNKQLRSHMEEGSCVSGYFFKGPIADKFYFALSLSWFVIGYALPCACFFILYRMVAISMQRRKRDPQFESNRYENFA